MKRSIITSEDGTNTIYVPELNEHYHSTFGALNESMHIFIDHGFLCVKKDVVNVLEIGFGTGLNAYLTLIESLRRKIKVSYATIEKYPLEEKEWNQLNYKEYSDPEFNSYFTLLHECDWEKEIPIHSFFKFLKMKRDLKSFIPPETYDIIYFDAFAPDVQPLLWSPEIFSKLYHSMISGGILLTYSVKGTVKKALKEAGFNIEKLDGPKGKRHIMRAIRK